MASDGPGLARAQALLLNPMRITSLTLSNIRCFPALTLDLDRDATLI